MLYQYITYMYLDGAGEGARGQEAAFARNIDYIVSYMLQIRTAIDAIDYIVRVVIVIVIVIANSSSNSK